VVDLALMIDFDYVVEIKMSGGFREEMVLLREND
jgi:hypothetical protein